jgi:hypothetical protein
VNAGEAHLVSLAPKSLCTLVFVEDDNDDQETRMPEKTITASCEIHGHVLNDIPVLNPNGWFGKAWLIELGGSYTPLFVIVEADNVSDAIDELSDNKTYGHQIHVSPDDLGDYPEDDRHYDGNGRVLDLDHSMVHGNERAELPYPVKYHGEGLPTEGIDPRKYDEFVEA